MKKTIISILAAAVCTLALSVPAFAEDILVDRSVYAENREELAKSVESWNIEGEVISVDPNTVMPYYYANFFDYARTGNFDIIPLAKKIAPNDDGEIYLANAINENGEFVGTTRFVIGGLHPGIHVVNHSTDKSNSLDFEPNAKRISAAMAKQRINSDCQEVKFVSVEWLGSVYYIDNGTTKFLAAASGRANGDVFNDTNGGIVEIGDELKAYADRKLAEYEEYKREVLDKLAPGENPPEGGIDTAPTFMVDNTPYLNDVPATDGEKNPNTGSTAVGAAALITLAAGVVTVCRKRGKKS